MEILQDYFCHTIKIFNKVKETQLSNIEEASKIAFQSIKNNNKFFIVGSGHSHMIAEEFYARAGGFANLVPILESELMLHTHPLKSTIVERVQSYANVIFDIYRIEKGDTLMIISNSGRNGMIVELSNLARDKGVKVIALTNIKHSKDANSRHSSGKKLYELADVVIDNCGDIGDATFKTKEMEAGMGASSTMIGAFVAQSMSILLADMFIKNNMEPPVFKSSNVDGGDKWNSNLFKKYCNV